MSLVLPLPEDDTNFVVAFLLQVTQGQKEVRFDHRIGITDLCRETDLILCYSLRFQGLQASGSEND